MSLKDCMIKNGFTEKEINAMTNGESLSEQQYIALMMESKDKIAKKVYDAKLQMVAIDGAMTKVIDYGKGEKQGQGLIALVGYDKEAQAGYTSAEMMANQYARFAFAEMSDMMEKLMPNWQKMWSVDSELRMKVVKEIFGEATGDKEAKAFAKSFISANEKLRVLHNKLGGNIQKSPDWHLPQIHNALKLQKVTREEWVNELLAPDVLDLTKMIDRETGEAFTNPNDLRPALNAMYDSIVTGGNSKMDWEKAQMQNLKAASGVQSRQRFLKFKTAESHLNYQSKYGEDDVFSSMITHITGLANDTALLKQFGPNPQAAFNYIVGKIRGKAPHKTQLRYVNRAENMMIEITGQGVGPNTTFQKWAESFRAVNVFKLGTAAASAIGDQATIGIAAKMNGLPVIKNLGYFLENILGLGHNKRQFLLQSGVNADYVLDVSAGLARYGEVDGLLHWGKLAKIPDRFLRMTGLNKMTEAGRVSLQLSTLAHFANIDNVKFKDLSAGNLRMLKESGVNEADYILISQSKKQDIDGAKFLDIRELPHELQIKMGNMMDVIAFHGVPNPDVEVKAVMRQGGKSGEIYPEIWKSVFQFKSYGISILLSQVGYAKQFGKVGGSAYLASTFVALTLTGLIASQVKQVAAGKEPMRLDRMSTWVTAMAQGGGLGIFADFIFKDQTRFGSSMVATAAGPTAASLEFILMKLMVAPTQKAFVAAIEQDPRAFKELAQQYGVDLTKLAKDNLPTQLWQSKLLFDRYVYQTVSQLSDPKYINKLHKREARMKKEEGRGLLFKPIDIR